MGSALSTLQLWRLVGRQCLSVPPSLTFLPWWMMTVLQCNGLLHFVLTDNSLASPSLSDTVTVWCDLMAPLWCTHRHNNEDSKGKLTHLSDHKKALQRQAFQRLAGTMNVNVTSEHTHSHTHTFWTSLYLGRQPGIQVTKQKVYV